MKSQTLQFTQLKSILLQKLKHHPTPQSLKNKHFLDQLDVLFLNKKPQTHTFVCDATTSIQVELKTEKAKPLQDYDLTPWNKVMTHYYQTTHQHDKYLYTLNCTDKNLLQRYSIKGSVEQKSGGGGMFNEQTSSLQNLESDYVPHVYEPLYYFPRNIFDSFLKNRQHLVLNQPLQKIRIYEWVLKVVNISKSNWYSFVIQIHKFKFLNEKVWVDQIQGEKLDKQNNFCLKNIGSIIYDQTFQLKLQQMRLKHIRQDMLKQDQKDEQDQVSMCYHLRNVQATHKLPKLSQFVALDIKGDVLKFDKNRPTYFVPIGQLQGMCSFSQPVNLNQPQKKEQKRQLNAFSMKSLSQILNKQVVKLKKDKLMMQKQQKYRKRRDDSNSWARMVKQKLCSSHNKGIQQETFSVSEEQSQLWSDSDANKEKEQKNREGQMQDEGQGYVTKYSDLLINVDGDESSEQEENEYFRKYRQEMKKVFQKQ